jgi:hypothetical protein
LTGDVKPAPSPAITRRQTLDHAKANRLCLRTIAASGLVLATEEAGNVTGQTT